MSAHPNQTCDLLNFGPGYGFTRSRVRHIRSISVLDVSTIDPHQKAPQSPLQLYSDDDIAIVGMAVDLPDAPDVNRLWDNLDRGVDSCVKVSDDHASELPCRQHDPRVDANL